MTLDSRTLAAAIVDLDGTLVDTLGDFTVALNRMLGDLALGSVGRDLVERLVGKGSEHLIRSVLGHVLASGGGAPAADAAAVDALYPRAWDSYQSHYQVVNGQQSEVYPGVAAGLEAMRARGWRLACLTNKPGAFAGPLLAAKGLDHFFGCVFGGDAFARKKPDPLPLLETCKVLGTPPSRTLVIGDSANDAQAARSAGCPVLLVTYGYNHGRPVRDEDADGFLDSLLDLAQR